MRFPALVAAMVLASSTLASAEEAPPSVIASARPVPKNTLTFNPLALVFGQVNFEYERAVSDRVSLFAGPSLLLFNVYGIDEDVSLTAYGAEAGARIFLSGTAPRGLWVSPTVGVAYASVDTGDDEASAIGFSAAALFGHTWIARSGLTFSLGIGAGYADMAAENSDGDRVGLRGPTVAGRLALGYAF